MKKFQYSLKDLVIKATLGVAIAASIFATIRDYCPVKNQEDSSCFRSTYNEDHEKSEIVYFGPSIAWQVNDKSYDISKYSEMLRAVEDQRVKVSKLERYTEVLRIVKDKSVKTSELEINFEIGIGKSHPVDIYSIEHQPVYFANLKKGERIPTIYELNIFYRRSAIQAAEKQ